MFCYYCGAHSSYFNPIESHHCYYGSYRNKELYRDPKWNKAPACSLCHRVIGVHYGDKIIRKFYETIADFQKDGTIITQEILFKLRQKYKSEEYIKQRKRILKEIN